MESNAGVLFVAKVIKSPRIFLGGRIELDAEMYEHVSGTFSQNILR